MTNIIPGKLCKHLVYTKSGKPDGFHIYPVSDDFYQEKFDSNGDYIRAEEIFMCLTSPTNHSSNAFTINVLTSNGFIRKLYVNNIYADRFVLVNGG